MPTFDDDTKKDQAFLHFVLSSHFHRAGGERKSHLPHFTFEDFLNYLYSPCNSILNPKHTHSVYQDMTQPMSMYFVNSSHNTYLTGISSKAHISPI